MLTFREYFSRLNPTDEQIEQLELLNVKLCMLGYEIDRKFVTSMFVCNMQEDKYFLVSWEKISGLYIYSFKDLSTNQIIEQLTVNKFIELMEEACTW